jgi:hypothetical protein
MIMLHARSTNKYNTGYRNWPEHYWDELTERLPQIMPTYPCPALILKESGWMEGSSCSIGSRSGALHIKGTADFREVPLKTLCNYMASSPLVIGPTSGPMHLAALCGAPHLVWTGHKRTLQRCQKDWNPLDTECMVFYDKFQWDEGKEWQPTVEEIIEGIREFDASLIRS